MPTKSNDTGAAEAVVGKRLAKMANESQKAVAAVSQDTAAATFARLLWATYMREMAIQGAEILNAQNRISAPEAEATLDGREKELRQALEVVANRIIKK